MKPRKNIFKVLNRDFENISQIAPYDVMPYIRNCYKEAKKKPVGFDQLKEFIDTKCRYQYWSRCEYEIIVYPFVSGEDKEVKLDVYYQIKMNLDLITKLLREDIENKNI